MKLEWRIYDAGRLISRDGKWLIESRYFWLPGPSEWATRSTLMQRAGDRWVCRDEHPTAYDCMVQARRLANPAPKVTFTASDLVPVGPNGTPTRVPRNAQKYAPVGSEANEGGGLKDDWRAPS